MPSAPLFYQPLVLAQVQATPIGDKTTVFDSYTAQRAQDDAAQKEFGPAIDTMIRGFNSIQSSLPGSTPMTSLQFSYDDDGFVANRVMTTMRLHPDMFDGVSPDQAAEMGAKLVQEGRKELGLKEGMKAVGDTLEVSPAVTELFRKHWTGKEQLTPEEAATVGVLTQRELQHAVTPLAPDTPHPKLQWVEDGTADILATLPTVAQRTIEALGIKHDAKKVEAAVGDWRTFYATEGPHAEAVRSVGALIGAAGIKTDSEAAFGDVFGLLQKTPLDGVPLAISQGIVGASAGKLPKEASDYIASRIVETGGTNGNITGLLAEIEQMKQPKPVDPPDAEPGTKPPDEELPPGVPPDGEPPPGEEQPAPVDPPKPDEAATPPPDAKPPVDDGTTVPGDDQVTKAPVEPPGEQPVNPPAGTAPAQGTDGMSEADAKALEEFIAQITAAQQAQQQAEGKSGSVGDPRLYQGEPAAAEPPAAGGDAATG